MMIKHPIAVKKWSTIKVTGKLGQTFPEHFGVQTLGFCWGSPPLNHGLHLAEPHLKRSACGQALSWTVRRARISQQQLNIIKIEPCLGAKVDKSFETHVT